MKRYIAILLGLFLVISFISLFSWFWWNKSIGPVSSDTESYSFVITKGSSAMQVANKLEEKGIIKSALAFKIYTQVSGKADSIQAGEFELSPGDSLFETVGILLSGPMELWVTIPEGLRREEIALRFAQGLEKEGNEYEVFVDDFLLYSKGEEGYLFPDTYLFPKEVEAQKVVGVLRDTFNKRIADMGEDMEGSDLGASGVVTLASLIERETKGVDERPVVAGILLKRLNADWPLQVDATVQYAISSSNCKLDIANCEWWPTLTRNDLDINSPYNTYKYQGIPPGPIANPGLISLEAATYPKDSDFWFYIHDDKGVIHYARTQEEHAENVSTYLGK
ncbi:endolytic transglycosylase MltG [Patescibacteria group bacterium]